MSLFLDENAEMGSVAHVAARIGELQGFKPPLFERESSRKLVQAIQGIFTTEEFE